MSLRARLAAAGADWIVPDWAAPSNVHAFSTTRRLGDGEIDFAPSGGDIDAARASLRDYVPSEPLWLAQQHGVEVVDADRPHARPPRADGAVARAPGRVCAILSGDCMPVLLAARDGSVVAAAHAGWRGLSAGILERTLAAMHVDPAGVIAWLGPAIGPTVFEVGDEVFHAFCDRDAGDAAAFVATRPGKWLADLGTLARRRLNRAGVASVDAAARCTLSEPENFFSYRRGGTDAPRRMATLIWRTAEDPREQRKA